MPFALEFEDSWRRPLKRRKISSFSRMARTNSREGSPPDVDVKRDAYLPTESDPPKSNSDSRPEVRTSDREELILCIKRGERPTWVPKPNLEALCAEANTQAEAINTKEPHTIGQQPSTASQHFEPASLRPPSPTRDPIPRPPSALHAGDFYEPSGRPSLGQLNAWQSPQPTSSSFERSHASPPPWMADAPPPRFLRMPSDSAALASSRIPTQRSRAPSLGSSLSSSFVLRTPTSPLVHATSSPSIDSVDDRGQAHPTLEDRELRRRTLPPQSFSSISLPQPDSLSSNLHPNLPRAASSGHRTHQSRRSLTSLTYQPASTAQGVYPSRNRRLSHASETPPRPRNSMVGSFEESILRGRMSTPPSKPLDFVAQIGVLGRGDCPAKLKCPAHVSVPFPAVFYNYTSTGGSRSISDDSPSPYVGTVDLAQHLNSVEELGKRKRKAESNDPDTVMAELTAAHNTAIGRALARRESCEFTEPISSPKTLLDGAYRVPQQGQLQVIIKNPNKTAVKLFLIPYDLSDMTPGTKTFVRQRSYSSGPIMENVLSDKPIQDPLSNKHVLRYLIHLKFCCLSKGRFYLYDNVRVVFANRVPEGKEKLRNEIQLPEPKYSPFTPGIRSQQQSLASSPTSSPSSFTNPQKTRYSSSPYTEAATSSFFSSMPIPFHMGRSLPQATILERTRTNPDDEPAEAVHSQVDGPEEAIRNTLRPQSPEVHGFDRVSTSQRGSPIPWNTNIGLDRGRSPSPALPAGDGLLSKKLREFGKQNGNSWLNNVDKPLNG